MAKCAWCGDYVPDDYKVVVTDPITGKRMVINEKFCSQRCCYEHERAGFTVTEKKSNKKGSCFVATAVYNNYDHPVVIDLRMFRDEFLIKKKWGQSFIRWYYMQGPKLAKFISKNNLRRIIAKLFIIKPLHIITRFIVKNQKP
jgi:hypothetical protein